MLERVGLSNVNFSLGPVTADQDITYGVALVYRTAIPGLRFGATYNHSESTIASDAVYTAQFGPAPVSFIVDTDTQFDTVFACVGSVEYQRGDLKLAAEYLRDRRQITTSATGIPGPPTPTLTSRTDGEAYYVQAAYRFSDLFQAQTYYAALWPNRDDRDGAQLPPAQQSEASTKDFALTGRFDIKSFWLLKAEYHRFNGTSILSPCGQPGRCRRGLEPVRVEDHVLLLRPRSAERRRGAATRRRGGAYDVTTRGRSTSRPAFCHASKPPRTLWTASKPACSSRLDAVLER